MESEPEEVEEVVTPSPSGLTVFSARLPAEELGELRREAARRQIPVSELIRAAVRAYLGPQPVLMALSAAAQPGTLLQIMSSTPIWSGGRVAHTEITSQEQTVQPTTMAS